MYTTGKLFLGVAAVVALAAGSWFGAQQRNTHEVATPEIAGFVLPEARNLKPFELVTDNEEIFVPADFRGRWSFLYFGYTFCPDVCPSSMVELAHLKENLETAHQNLNHAYFLVTIDPKRDTPKRLNDYAGYFDPSFQGLTGQMEQIAIFAKQAGVIHRIPEGQDEQNYLVDHSSTITLIDPDGKLHAVFTSPLKATQIADDFAQILSRYRQLNS